jgi:hypothetical protein
MPTPVETAEARAKAAIARLEDTISAGVPFAFTPLDCQYLLTLIDALRDQPPALYAGAGNPFERPCSFCGGRRDEDQTCDVCDNLDMVPTAIGRKILDMVERHYITSVNDDVMFMLTPEESARLAELGGEVDSKAAAQEGPQS